MIETPSNVVPFPRGAKSRGGRPRKTDPPRAVTRLPAARPAPLPTPGAPRPARPAPPRCSAGEACSAHERTGSPAKLSRHNRQKVGGKRYCYRCREEISAELSRSTDRRHDSEAAAAARFVSRRKRERNQECNQEREPDREAGNARPGEATRR